MKALRSFTVRTSLPEPLRGLLTVAANLRWSWDRRALELFRTIHPVAWEEARHDPIRMLGLVSKRRFEEVAADEGFLDFLREVESGLHRYLEEPRWYQKSKGDLGPSTIAYFSPEFGVTEALPIYSGGLGVLAGDHLKAASDLGVPLVALGLLYRQGYFRQQLNADGWQQEEYPALDPHLMPLELVQESRGTPVKVEVELAGVPCSLQVWRAHVGRVPLLLLDSDVTENRPDERKVTDRLYGGGTEHRLRQEIVLGIGGVRALGRLGYEPDVFHTNEGHAGFLGLERIRQIVVESGLSFGEALEAVRAGTVFTTHTPVPAGIDVYHRELMERYFSSFAQQSGVSFDELFALGRASLADGGVFNMAVMGLRLAARSNGVSKLHGEVSRSMFSGLWPSVPHEEVPITSVTNGVHAPTWIGPEIGDVFESRLPGWTEAGESRWDAIADVTNEELWQARCRARERLVSFLRARLYAQLLARGQSEVEASWAREIFGPDRLTIGFARRFAQYKRGTLLLSDPDRLKALLLSSERPVQIVLAGKAHPQDVGGKEMIQRLVHFASDPAVRDRFAFLEDYDMEAARMLTQGADLWLNNPRRLLEASGTSGMKAALNGGLNCSILDGWWDECYESPNGWAIGTRKVWADSDYQDRVDASALYDLLAREIVPRFYDRHDGVPHRWVETIKVSIAALGGRITADRMVRDYVEDLYLPASAQRGDLATDGYARARALAAWKARVRSSWSEVVVVEVDGDEAEVAVGDERRVRAEVRLGSLAPAEVTVQLAHGRVGANGELADPEIVEMKPTDCADGTCSYEGSFMAEAAGQYGFTVRVLPSHPDLASPMDLGLVTWA